MWRWRERFSITHRSLVERECGGGDGILHPMVGELSSSMESEIPHG